MEVSVLRAMKPDEVRAKLGAFTAPYVTDWENWLQADQSDRVARFAAILRSWQATRPLPLRRPRAEASHEPPFIEDLLAEVAPQLEVLGDVTVADLATASPAQFAALHGLWAVFSKLPQRGTASCVGITKAVMLLTYGRIGPAFDSLVRKALGLKDHLRSSEEWVGSLLGISADIRAFEAEHGKLADIVPKSFATYHVGRLYDMVLGPGASDADGRTVPSPEQVVAETAQPIPAKVDIREKLALFDDHWNPPDRRRVERPARQAREVPGRVRLAQARPRG